MASWLDIFALFTTIVFFGGIIYGIYIIVNAIDAGVDKTKEKLKEQGLHVSDKGVSVKTAKRFDREDYVDATQRGFVKALNAASYGNNGVDETGVATQPSAQKPLIKSHSKNDSTSSLNNLGEEEKRKRGLFGRKKKA